MPTVLDRFWSKVDATGDGCWPWRSGADTYPRFRILPDRRAIGGHVFSWILANRRDVPAGLVVMHSCDNKRCVNPAHLSVGTVSDNTLDATRKGLNDPSRAWSARKRSRRCFRGHELTDESVYINGRHRRCRKCHAMRAKQYRGEGKLA